MYSSGIHFSYFLHRQYLWVQISSTKIPTMKSSKILVFVSVLVMASCSKKSDPQPSLSSASLSLSTAQVVTFPASLSTSTDAHAQEAYSFVESVNAIGSFTGAFTV